MRRGFEGDLSQFSKLIKSEAELKAQAASEKKAPEGEVSEETAEALSALDADISVQLKRAAQEQDTSTKTQRKVFDIQRSKQTVMEGLKMRLECLDNPECRQQHDPNARPAEYKEADKTFHYKDGKGVDRNATFGEVLTDMGWGVTYALDKDKVPRHLIKRYEIERSKQQISDLLDQQIIQAESRSTRNDEGLREVYRAVGESIESGHRERASGFVAERMVKNFLKKAVVDDGAPFEVRPADVHQDVAQTIDFIISRKDANRGVKVEAADLPQDVGIQFSTNLDAEAKKRRQVDKARQRLDRGSPIDDLMLVVMPMRFVQRFRSEWEDAGRPAGGPDKLMRRDTARAIYEKLLGGVLSKEEIEESWDKVKGRFVEGRDA